MKIGDEIPRLCYEMVVHWEKIVVRCMKIYCTQHLSCHYVGRQVMFGYRDVIVEEINQSLICIR